MPPIFVDGVEIDKVFVDGVEQDKVFADGVEVYSGAPEGDFMFDDFGRDANGTLLTNHLMNTGQGWLYGPGDGGSRIQTRQGTQAASVTGGVGDSISVSLIPQPVVRAPYFSSVLDWGTAQFIPTFRISAVGMSRNAGNSVIAVFQSNFGQGFLFIQVGVLGDQSGLVNIVDGVNDDRGLFEAWYDGRFAQCRITISSGVYTTVKVAVPEDQTRYDEATVSDLNFGNVGTPSLKNYTLTPYNQDDVPFV